MRLTYLLSLSLSLSLGVAAASLPQSAAAQSATLDPGLYDVSAVVTLAGQLFAEHEAEECIRKGKNDKLSEILTPNINKFRPCTNTQTSWTASSFRAEFLCKDLKTGSQSTDRSEASFGTDFANLTSTGTVGPGMEIKAVTNMRRKGECPANAIATRPYK